MPITRTEPKSVYRLSVGLTLWQVMLKSGQTTSVLTDYSSIVEHRAKEKTCGWAHHTGLALPKWLRVGVTKSSILSGERSQM